MLLEIGNFLLSIERNPFRLTICRAGNVILRTAPHPQNVVAVHRTDSALQLDFSSHSLVITVKPAGFDLQVTPATATFAISFEMTGHWYGHGELIHQILPLERLMLPESVFQTYDNGFSGQSGKLTPAWFSSRGALIQAHSPVSVGINQPPASEEFPRYAWSLGAEKGPFAHRPFADCCGKGDGLLTLRGEGLHLSLSCAPDAVRACKQLIETLGIPENTPPESLFIKPTWTTWARYKTAVSQEVVLQFADEIIGNGYPYGVMEIDDRWQVHYGDFSFDPQRFPNAQGMIDELHAKGFKVTAWIIPFFDQDGLAFAEGREHGYLVRQEDGTPYLVQWWQGRGGLLDATNPQAMQWFFASLEKLQRETGLDGFKFDAGEACFFPPDGVTAHPIHPNEYTHHYVDAIGKQYSLTEVRSGWNNQRTPIFFREWDKWSTWGRDNGLHSVLTGILALGLTGYPFVLPDMVGGNAYEENADAELMIRWTQLNALLPAVQFSLAPWDYGEECADICRRYAKLHEEYAPRILELAAEATRSGAPIIRPVWWLAAHDERALTCDDEFLLGDDILVAPVVNPGQRSRDIYLPPGLWREHASGVVYEGGMILENHPAALDVLPFFKRQPRIENIAKPASRL
jgi:alpha-glucosidase (family GH31 glycosyl hydrolase)